MLSVCVEQGGKTQDIFQSAKKRENTNMCVGRVAYDAPVNANGFLGDGAVAFRPRGDPNICFALDR